MRAAFRTPMAWLLALAGAILLLGARASTEPGAPVVCTRGCGLPTPTRTPVLTPTPTPGGACTTEYALCLGQGRSVVTARWTKPDGTTGLAHAVRLTSDSGAFWFLEPGNLELAVKVLDGCAVNGHRWFFAAGLTNLAVRITVADLTDGSERIYTNEQGAPFQTIADTAAFATCAGEVAWRNPEEPAEEIEEVAGGDGELLLQNRFQVEADWETASGRTGVGHAVQISPESGYFWFFDPDNVELVVKTLDACAIGSGTWFFGAGMTRVGVRIRVTDTATGDVRTYSSPVNALFAPILDTHAFATCASASPSPTPTPTTTATPTPGSGERHLVRVVCRLSCEFLPSSLHVSVGDTVHWYLVWPNGGLHSTVADHGEWDSGPPGPSFDHTFNSPGTFPYHCGVPHLFVHSPGEIVVDRSPAGARPLGISDSTPTPTPHFQPRLTNTPTHSPTPSRTPTVTPTRTHTPIPSSTPTPTVSGTATPTPEPQTYFVVVRGGNRGYVFVPGLLHVRVGDTVHWDLFCLDDGTHHRTAALDGRWDSGPPGPFSFSYTFSQTGRFSYTCGYDPHNPGTIFVDP
jgi:plastocyanin